MIVFSLNNVTRIDLRHVLTVRIWNFLLLFCWMLGWLWLLVIILLQRRTGRCEA